MSSQKIKCIYEIGISEKELNLLITKYHIYANHKHQVRNCVKHYVQLSLLI